MSYLRIDKSKCSGCRICESACSMAKEGVLNKAKSRIRVMRRDVVEMDHKVCIQCKDPQCVSACPGNAITQQEGMVRVIPDRCNGCGECLKVCDRLFLSPDRAVVLMCDQCGECVGHCPESALKIIK